MAEPRPARTDIAVAEMAQETAAAGPRDVQQQPAVAVAPAQAQAPVVVPASDPALSATAARPVGLSAVEAAKTGAASDHVEGTGVSHVHVAQELGVATLSNEQHEQKKQLDAQPVKPQDLDTGGLVKQHDTAETEALDADTYNTWSHPDEVPKELVKGIENDELWKVIRRFDKQMYHVKATTDGRKRGLWPELEMDLVNSEDEEFSPDRLRSNLERVYINFGIGAAGFFKHIQRVRSWNEFNRTATWCAIYFTFWLFAQVGLLLVGLIILLMVYPPSRHYIFPPAPLSMMSASSGGLQKPKAGNTVGSKDRSSLTGASEAHKGEAVENEATNFVNGIASVATATAIGKAPEKDYDQSSKKTKLDSAIPDPTDVIISGGEAQNKAAGGQDKHLQRAKDPVVDSIWKAMRPAMRGLEDACDNYERLANALSPTPPYPEHLPRLRLAAILLPVALLFMFVKVQYMARGATLFMGLGFFSQPYMSKGWQWFTTNYPNWKELLLIQNTLLKGVPSNNQLALTLLRIGEDHNTPLPPPPQYEGEAPTRSPSPTLEDDLPPVNPDTAERDLSHDHEYAGDDLSKSAVEDNSPTATNTEAGKHKKHRFIGFLKGTAKTTVSAVMGADRVKAQAGSQHSKERQGVLRKRNYVDGPSMFRCRHDGKKGWALISTSATTPCIAWVRDNKLPGTRDFDPKFSIQLQDIVQLKKLGGLGWKSKLVLGGGLGMEIIDGMSLVTADGENIILTAMPRRDEMFNRLIALSQNRWDSF